MISERAVRQEIALLESARPTIKSDIDVIWVFSAFGTYLTPLLPNHPEWGAWFDQRNIAKGIYIAIEVTAQKTGKRVQEVTKEDIEGLGPILVYNGELPQNQDLRWASSGRRFLVPKTRMRIEDYVEEDGETRTIFGTLDQFKSFPRDVLNENGGVIALVTGAPHYSRVLRYNGKHRTIPENYEIRCFPVPSYDAAEKFADQEIEKLFKYFEKGDLSEEPCPKNLGLE